MSAILIFVSGTEQHRGTHPTPTYNSESWSSVVWNTRLKYQELLVNTPEYSLTSNRPLLWFACCQKSTLKLTYFTSKIYKSKTILKMPCKLSLTVCQLQRLEVWRGYLLGTGELPWMVRSENRVTEQTRSEFQAPDKIQDNTTSLGLWSSYLKFTPWAQAL